MTAKGIIKLGLFTALFSFLLGTFIFAFYYLTSDPILLFVGYGFIALTCLINFGVLIPILFKAAKDKENRKPLLKTSCLMLLNIPVMIVYCWIAIILLGIMRITFTNGLDTEITNINIVGCEGGYIDKLEVGESETVWISIKGDCSIYVDYLSDGHRKKEMVVGYVTSNGGQKAKHKIAGKDKKSTK